MKFIIYTFLFLLLPLCSSATCVIITFLGNKIYVIADSRQSTYYKNEITGEIFPKYEDNVCKIHKVGQYYFAMSGYWAWEMLDGAKKSIQPDQSFEEFMTQSCINIKNNHERQAEICRTLEHDVYLKRVNKSLTANVAFFGFENNSPVIRQVVFKIISTPNEKVKIEQETVKTLPIYMLGEHAEIDKLSKAEVDNIFESGDMVKILKTMITIEASKTPSVGAPFDFLVLSPEGENWLERKKECN